MIAYFIGGIASAKLGWIAEKAGNFSGAVRFLLGLFVSYVILEKFRLVLLMITKLLHRASRMTETRSAAVAGRLMLVAGFGLQFAGTLEQA